MIVVSTSRPEKSVKSPLPPAIGWLRLSKNRPMNRLPLIAESPSPSPSLPPSPSRPVKSSRLSLPTTKKLPLIVARSLRPSKFLSVSLKPTKTSPTMTFSESRPAKFLSAGLPLATTLSLSSKSMPTSRPGLSASARNFVRTVAAPPEFWISCSVSRPVKLVRPVPCTSRKPSMISSFEKAPARVVSAGRSARITLPIETFTKATLSMRKSAFSTRAMF